MRLPAVVIAGLDAAVNGYLRLDPGAMARLAKLDVDCIAIELRGLDLTLYALPGADGVSITDHYDGTPNATLSGTVPGLAQIGLGGDREHALFSGEVEIRGDVESGQAFQDVLEDMDIDWEEHLSRVTGDVIAHHVGNTLRHAGRLLRQGRASARQNTTEYLQEELRVLPAPVEIENFCREVMQTAMDTDRLAARVQRLQQRLTTGERA